ncbi:hypothetical protein HAV15_011756 [Penicillium sp. str. |nr:hypothetical protein HAV15_011756 [Penicillium sp. str. \
MDSLSRMSSGSLSPPVSEAQFDAYTAARQKMFARLDEYESLNDDDDTVRFLTSVFHFLPTQGQSHLADDVDLCHNDDQLRQLVKHLETTLLKPMLAAGRTTPAITPSPLSGVNDSAEDLTGRQSELRRICLQHNNNQCVIAKAWGHERSPPPDAITGDLEAAHIIKVKSIDEDNRPKRGFHIKCFLGSFSIQSQMSFVLHR